VKRLVHDIGSLGTSRRIARVDLPGRIGVGRQPGAPGDSGAGRSS